MTTSARILKNTGFLYLRLILTFVLSLITTRILLNSLGVSDFGIYQVVCGAIGMLMFLNSSLTSATQRFMSYTNGEKDFDKLKSIFNVSIVLHFIVAVIICILFAAAGYFFFNGILNISEDRLFAAKVAYVCLVVTTVLTVINVPYDAILNAHENMLYYSIIGVVESILKLLVAIACMFSSYDRLIVYSVLLATIPFITLTIMKLYCHKHYEECVIDLKRYLKRPLMSQMTKFAGWNLFGSFAGLVSGHGNNILINYYFGTAVNAGMGVYSQVNAQMQSFSSTLLKALNPVMVKNEGGKNRQSMYQYAFTGAKLSVCLYAFFAIPIIIDREYILHIWLKVVPPYTTSFIGLALIWTFFSQIGGTLNTTIGAIGRIKETQVITATLKILMLLFIFMAFSNGYPPYCWMIISCIISLIQLMVVVIYNHKYGEMNIGKYLTNVFIRTILSIFISYICVYTLWSLIDIKMLRLIVTIVASVIVYGALFYTVALDTLEKKKIRELICRKVVIFNR